MARAETDSDVSWATTYRDDQRLASLLGPGCPFEVEELIRDGVTIRSFVHAPASLVDVFRMSRAHEDLVHVVFEGERLTFGAIRAQALSLAAELQSAFGVRAGDRVAIAMRNFPEFIVAFWGAAVLGAIVVPLNSWWTGGELAYALDDAGAKVVIVDDERAERLARVHYRGTVIAARAMNGAHGVPLTGLTAGAPIDEAAFADLGPDDPVMILYSSGTTGQPKGVLSTSRAMIANLMNMGFAVARETIISGREVPAPQQSAGVMAGPLFHIGGISAIVGGAMAGTKLVLVRKWDVSEVLALAEAEQVAAHGGVPTMARQLLDFPELPKYDVEVRTFSLGGAPVPPDLPVRALEVFGESIQLLNGYGCTETTSAVVTNVGIEYAAHPDSVGRPNLTADIQVQDLDGRPVPRGEVGELCFRSPQVMKAYWNNPEATAAAVVDGWCHTGDLGFVDGDGFVYVVDRIKDVVIRGGENVYCTEVEAVLFGHPNIENVAVIGLPDELMGERVCAVIVPRDGTTVHLADVRDYVAAHLAAFKHPEALFLMPELPQTATGKTDKLALRAAVTDDLDDLERYERGGE